ncbi:MAG TPA: hypothetical protein VFA68_22185 [Terriglobales bacterium]|nr:hypothetical protein [Terriglobales bacterium]
MSTEVIRRCWPAPLMLLLLVLVPGLASQTSKTKIGWPSQIVLVRDDLTPAGSLGHLFVNGKEVAVTLEPNGERAQITVSRAHLHYSAADGKEDYAIVLDDLEDGDTGNKLEFHLGNLEEKAAGCVLIGTGYEPSVVTADVTSEAGKKLLREINQQKDAGKEIEYSVEGDRLRLKALSPVNSSEALAKLRRALFGAAEGAQKDVVVNFDFRASDDYKAEVQSISESIVRQLVLDEKRLAIKAREAPSATSGDAGNSNAAAARSRNSASIPSTGTKLTPQKPGDQRNSVEQGFKRSVEPEQPTTFDNKPTPPAQQSDKKKNQPPQ